MDWIVGLYESLWALTNSSLRKADSGDDIQIVIVVVTAGVKGHFLALRKMMK
jgi:hypothetical protein